jgi:serine-type D-Ala-D-Ala carboxypeptidase (penicillin-binding protein 5/6)
VTRAHARIRACARVLGACLGLGLMITGALTGTPTAAAGGTAAATGGTAPAAGTGTGAGTATADAAPNLTARTAVLVDEGTGQRLYGRAADRQVPIASATKLMTALLTLEQVHRLEAVFTQNLYYSSPVESQIGLVPGERMTVHDLLLALMLPSADDAAEDLAYNLGHGSIGRFIALMNVRARELGLAHTHYSTPIGLDTPGNFSSASDLVRLAGYLLTHSRFFARIVALPHAVLHSGNHPRVVLNRNDLVGRVPWIDGVKTGHTAAAGYVLVGSGTKHGMTLLSAVLGTPSMADRDGDTLALQDYGFREFRLMRPLRAGTVLARPAVRDRPGVRAELIAARSFARVVPATAALSLRVAAPRELAGPQRRHAVIGSVAVLINGRPVARIPLLLAAALPAVSPLTLAAHFLTRLSTLLVLVPLAVVALVVAGLWRVRARVRGAAGPEAA